MNQEEEKKDIIIDVIRQLEKSLENSTALPQNIDLNKPQEGLPLVNTWISPAIAKPVHGPEIPGQNGKIIIRQSPRKGKAIGFTQQFGNFL